MRAAVIKRVPLLSLPTHELADVMALKAVNDGVATEEQQQRFVRWLIRDVGMIGGVSFVPKEETSTAFNEGRRFVAIALNYFINEPAENVRRRLGKPNPKEES